MSSTRRRKQTNPQHIATPTPTNINNHQVINNDDNLSTATGVQCSTSLEDSSVLLCGGRATSSPATGASVAASASVHQPSSSASSSEEEEEEGNNLLHVNNPVNIVNQHRENGPLSSSEDESCAAPASGASDVPVAAVGAGDEHICGCCRGEFLDLASFLAHKKRCGRKAADDQVSPSLPSPAVTSMVPPADDLYVTAMAVAAAAMQLSQHPSANMVDKTCMLQMDIDEKGEAGTKSDEEESTSSTTATTPPAVIMPSSAAKEDEEEFADVMMNNFQYDSNVLLQSLPNTKVAVSQISAAAAAVALNAMCAASNDRLSPSPLNAAASLMNTQATSELVMLQSTLYSLQQQQMLQLQLIQQLQQQLTTTSSASTDVNGSAASNTTTITTASALPASTTTTTHSGGKSLSSSVEQSVGGHLHSHLHHLPSHHHHHSHHRSVITPPTASSAPLNLVSHHGSLSSIAPSLTSTQSMQPLTVTSTVGSSLLGNVSVINSSSGLSGNAVLSPDDVKESTNSLELLQRSAQQVLNNASQGLLTADLHFRSGSSSSRNGGAKSGSNGGSGLDSKSGFGRHHDDGFFKHRCRYCGKVFGSDSALQIHIRSHTGERPFKCNVCGNRFSTKGNLKVHFQRHRAKYPHIKMNPNPVPEHLDKYGPPPLQPPSPVGGSSGSSLQQQSLQPPPSLLAMATHHFANSGFIPSSPLNSFRSSSLDTGQFHHHHPFLSRGHDGQPSVPHPIPLFSHSSMDHHSLCPQKPMEDDHRLPNIKSEVIKDDYLDARTRVDSLDEPLDVTKDSLSATNKASKQAEEGSCDEEEEDDDMDRTEDDEANRPLAEGDWRLRQSQEDEDDDMMGNSPRSLMDEDEVDADDDFMDDLGSETSETSRGLRNYHHDGTSQPLPSRYSPLMRPHRSSSRHSAPPIATFSSNTRDGMDDDGDEDDDDDHRKINLSNLSGSDVNPRPSTDPLSNKPDVVSDPALYTPLLPKPGSNDNSWETLIEVTKSSETAKLQQLVDNIEHKLSDPNQCIVCHRVLSCKSALQMHYRTHTGERPFRCKICGRAFTTKGNLKTHMGVHRIKPPMRTLHQCPVCHRKFTNALVLQQHIKMHTGEPTEMTAEQIYAAEIKDFSGHPPTERSPSLPPTSTAHSSPPMMSPMSLVLPPFAPPRPPPPPPPPTTAQPEPPKSAAVDCSNKPLTDTPTSVIRCSSSVSDKDSDRKSIIASMSSSTPPPPPPIPMSNYSTSLAALENHVKTISTPPPSLAQFGHLMAVASGAILPPPHPHNHHHHHHHQQRLFSSDIHHPLAYISGPMHSLAKYRRLSDSSQQQNSNGQSKDPRMTPSPTSSISDDRIIKRESASPNNNNNNNNNSSNNNGGGRNTVLVSRSPSPGSVSSVTNSEASMSSSSALDLTPRSVITSSSSMSKSLEMSSLPLHLQTPGRFSTTCTICFKTFACNSALEIHFRSHTKERPFKCGVCERAFSTKGNMKQHMLTHKIRDLPAQFFDPNNSMLNDDLSHHSSPHSLPPPPVSQPVTPSPQLSSPSPQGRTTTADSNERRRALSPEQSNHRGGDRSSDHHHSGRRSDHSRDHTHTSSHRRHTSSSKHPCAVCHKCFSSASALMIHMRTHTGDKPFKCNVCERAFTTKGNLKVHMGTHMWNNGTSRRGRRMSIDLPPLSINPKDADHMSRRPEHLYFPYLTPPFLNGMAAKMNEISVIQSAVLNNGYFGSSMIPGVGVSSMMSGGSTPTSASNDAGSATALRHAAELDLSCKKSPLHAEGACRSGSGSAHSSPATSPAASGRSFERGRSLDEAEDDRQLFSSDGSRSPTPIGGDGMEPSPSTQQSGDGAWMQQWKVSCNTCNKVCHSPTELEDHIRIHFKGDKKEQIMDMSNKADGLQV